MICKSQYGYLEYVSPRPKEAEYFAVQLENVAVQLEVHGGKAQQNEIVCMRVFVCVRACLPL